MNRRRVWIIPGIIIMIIGIAWLFRFEGGGKQTNKAYYVDKWTGQTWVKEVRPSGYQEYPFIPEEIIVTATQLEYETNPATKSKMDEIEAQISQYNKIANDNLSYYTKFNKLSDQYSREWLAVNRPDLPNSNSSISSISNATWQQEIRSRIPQEIENGDFAYLDAQNNIYKLNLQKQATWQNLQNFVAQNLYDKASTKRKMASAGSMTLGSVALVWLIYLFVFDKKELDKLEERNPEDVC